jgi:putative transcriptional regulator
MMIKHHLNDELLMGYAAGILPEAFSMVAATHVSLCDDCRARLAAYEAVGGAVLEEGTAAMDAGVDACLARSVEQPARKRRQGVMPGPLVDYIGGDLSAVKWRSLGMGVRQAILPTSRSASARLLYIPAGVAVPDHGHRGMELTLVLQGAFRDSEDRFGVGDLEIAGEELQHIPVAEAGADCICLAATDAPLRFKDWMPRILQPIFRI